MGSDIADYSDKMPVSSQVQLIYDFNETYISQRLSLIRNNLNVLIPNVTETPLIEQIISLDETLDCEAYRGVFTRNPAFALSSNQLHTVIEQIASNMDGRNDVYGSNHEIFSSVVSSLFNAGVSNILEPTTRALTDERRVAAEEMLSAWAREGKI